MEDRQQEFRDIRSGLSSDDTKILAATLQEVKKSGDPALIPELIALLRRTNTKEITKQIFEILNNLKVQSSAKELARAIRKTKQEKLLSYLVAACWKNGLDFTDYIDDFIDVFIQYDYLLALEALTVIENSTENFHPSYLEERIAMLEDHVEAMGESKQTLTRELIHVLRKKKEHQSD